ncbi:MAG: hypothetical protein R2725_07305 [Solirubrobacterales bacterium]
MIEPRADERLRDRLWIWAHPEGSYNGPQWGLPGDSRITPLESAVWLGVPNVILISYGDLPHPPLTQYAKPLAAASQLMWSVVGGGGETSEAMRAEVTGLISSLPNLVGIFMDDFFHFRGSPPSQWLAKPGVDFPVSLEVTLPTLAEATRVELVQSDAIGGDHRSAGFQVDLRGSEDEWWRVGEGTLPNSPGAVAAVDFPRREVAGLRVAILGSHDEGGAMSCGLQATRLGDGDAAVALDDAELVVSSRYPVIERSIEERMAVTDGSLGADWADPALFPPEVLIESAPSVAASLAPSEVAELRTRLPDRSERPVEIGVAVYDYQLGLPSISRHLELIDVPVLWHWDPTDLPQLPRNLERLRRFAPGKRPMVGLYMWDFAKGRPIPQDLYEGAWAEAIRLLGDGEIDGVVLLAGNLCDLDLPAVEWTRGWLAEHGDRPL